MFVGWSAVLGILLWLGLVGTSLSETTTSAVNDPKAGALSEIENAADRICGTVATAGEYTSESVTGSVDAELTGLFKRVANLGFKGSAGGSHTQYKGVVRSDLPEALISVQKCKTRIFEDLRPILLPAPKAATKIKPCRLPSHGIEKYLVDIYVNRASGWVQGATRSGHDFYDDELNSVRAEHPNAVLTVVDRQDPIEDDCPPFHCILYNYESRIHVQDDPIYRLKVDPACP